MNDFMDALKAWVKPLIWSTAVLMLVLEDAVFVKALLLFSPLMLMPLWCGTKRPRQKFEYVAAMMMAGSFSFLSTPGIQAAWLAVPWLVARLFVVKDVSMAWNKRGMPSAVTACEQAAAIFPAVGAAWLVAYQAKWTPWGFDPLIVLLTAAHFHHAGFTLPLMAGLNAKAKPSLLTKGSCIAILAGVPLVAIGITCTHFGVLPFVEPFGVTVLVLGALGVAVSQLRRGLEAPQPTMTRFGFLVSGASLLFAMLLALGFGLRYVIPNFALTMPQMWMIHGTLNAFGFGLCGILAWRASLKPDVRP
ncbi:YndJ family transporter [Prosthecobacter sp.]|uniref:YndJ family transporter n=1 Tax=Prosthecobacter sp. TaxID=1965333 RepID=UPI001DB5C96C|nr:YndJ family transporter [Prosthecobacter sp.]MCB1275235.1 YndJ family transporter [Prosthecobacter sp.]